MTDLTHCDACYEPRVEFHQTDAGQSICTDCMLTHLQIERDAARKRLAGAVPLTFDEIRAVRMGLRWGVPLPEPELIKAARLKLEAAEVAIGGPATAAGALPRTDQTTEAPDGR